MTKSFTSLFCLDGHRALVIGASDGLGRHFAMTLALAGADVFVAARRTDKLTDLVVEIRRCGGKAQAVRMDVTNGAGIRAAFDEIASIGGPADIIVNSAGITNSKPFLEQSEEDWDAIINTNLRGAWLVVQEAARRLVGGKIGGSIVNVASILGERVASHVGPYAVSKAGLIQATKVAALELARHSIRVNAILPGYIATELNKEFMESPDGERLRGRVPTRMFGCPRHLDGSLLLLVSAAGAHITGATLAIDGGHLVSSL